MAWLTRARARRVIWSRPSMPMVVIVAQRVEVFLPAGRRDIETFASSQIHSRGKDVNMTSAICLVQDCRICNALAANSGKGNALEVVQHIIDFGIGRRIFWRECYNTGSVAMLEIETISNESDMFRNATQHADFCTLNAVMVMRAGQVARCIASTAGAMVKELDMHSNLLHVAPLLARQQRRKKCAQGVQLCKQFNSFNTGFVCIHPSGNLVDVVANPGQLTDKLGICWRVVAADPALRRGDARHLAGIDLAAQPV